MTYKWCLVPGCNSNTKNTPEKLFIYVPTKPTMRKIWLEAARRNPYEISATSCVYICEDHFDIEKDMANYNQYKMGFSKKIRIADGVVPSRFNWLDDQKKRMSEDNIFSPEPVKQQKIMPIEVQPDILFLFKTEYEDCELKRENEDNSEQVVQVKQCEEVTEEFMDVADGHKIRHETQMEYFPNMSCIKLTEDLEVKRENEDVSEQFVYVKQCEEIIEECMDVANRHEVKRETQIEHFPDMLCTKITEDYELKNENKINQQSVDGNEICNEENETNGERNSNLQSHIDTFPSNLKKHKCNTCAFASNRKTDVRMHIDSVHLKLRNHKCDICDYAAFRKADLKSHHDSVHLNSRMFQCKLCNKAFNQKKTLQKHIKIVHLNLKNYKCDRCDYATHSISGLQIHIETVHLKLKKHKCKLCDYATNKKSELRYHIDGVHLSLKEFKCDLCDFDTNRNGVLKEHIDSVHLKLRKFKCDICEFAANKRKDLRRHIDTVHLSLKNYKCDYCDYATGRKGHLQSHIKNVHLNLKEYKCDQCDYASSRKQTLMEHIDGVHLNLKRHICVFCDFASNAKSSLNTHIKGVHLKQGQ